MPIKFICPNCKSNIIIEGIDYRLCPICKYSEKSTEKEEVTVHEELADSHDSKTVIDAIKRGISKFSGLIKF